MAEYLSRTEVAERLQISRETLRVLRRDSDFPEPKRIGLRRLLWNAEDVEQWMETR